MKILTLALLLSTPAAPQSSDVVDTAVAAGRFTTLATALTEAELVAPLKGDGPFTVFAPTDEAFAALPEGTLESLLDPANKDTLTRILTYHVLPGRATAEDAVGVKKAKTLAGDEVRFSIQDGRLRVNGATVVANDVQASNGVIHVIDTVLLPPGVLEPKDRPKGRKVIGVYAERPGEALASQLGVDRHGSLLVTRLVEGGNAEKAGLRQYDVITVIDGEPATDDRLSSAKESRGVGGRIDLEVIRRGERMHVRVEVGVARH